MAVDASGRVALTERLSTQTPVDQQELHDSTASQRTRMTSQSQLLSLPAEVLQAILRLLLKSTTPLSKLEKRRRRAEERVVNRHPGSYPFGVWRYHPVASFKLHPQLLRVCRGLYDAGWTVLYKENTWVFNVFHGPHVDIAYLHPDPIRSGKVLWTGSPFGNNDQDTKGPPESVRNHMKSFNFDVQLDALTYRRRFFNSDTDFFHRLSDDARKMLSGKEKRLRLSIKIRPQLLTSAKTVTEDPDVNNFIGYFGSFKSVRCASMGVEVNDVQLDTDLAAVMTSAERIEEELPNMWTEYTDLVEALWNLRGFPHNLERLMKYAVKEWDADEFRCLRKEILEVVDSLLEQKRLDVKRYQESL